MAYVRKTVDTWEIQGFYYCSWELETTETSRKDAKERIKEYRQNMPRIPHRIIKKREKIQKGA